jgi:hypothetical protein
MGVDGEYRCLVSVPQNTFRSTRNTLYDAL